MKVALWLALFAMWLLLNQTLAPGHLVFGALLALGGVWALARLQPAGPVRRLAGIGTLAWLVLVDVVRSNLAVARLVVYRRSIKRVAGFVRMPLAVRRPAALAVMACIVTATPGTSWARYDRRGNVLTIHVFDLIDEEAWVQTFKQRYERLLMEIFE
jgi:multicomponent K+:H+ antiporter subunit E